MKNYKILKDAVNLALRPACEKYGFVTYRIISHWEQIMGKNLAALSFPVEVIFPKNKNDDGFLIVGVSNPGFSLEIQASESIILSKLASYFGYRAITKIKIKIIQKSNINSSSNILEETFISTKIRKNVNMNNFEEINDNENKNFIELINQINDKDIAQEIIALKNTLFVVNK